MKLISLLVTLLLIAFIAINQLESNSQRHKTAEVIDSESMESPKVPTSPKDVLDFKEDINKYVQDNANKTTKELEKSLSQ